MTTVSERAGEWRPNDLQRVIALAIDAIRACCRAVWRRGRPDLALGLLAALAPAMACGGTPPPEPPPAPPLSLASPSQGLHLPPDEASGAGAPELPALAAVEVVELSTGRTLLAQRADVLEQPTWPASVAKVFTLRAALDAGLVDARTRVTCTQRLTVGARTVQCVHPRFQRPLSAVDALAHSCNTFFVVWRIA